MKRTDRQETGEPTDEELTCFQLQERRSHAEQYTPLQVRQEGGLGGLDGGGDKGAGSKIWTYSKS